MGLGSEIYPKYGIEGFYLNELLDLNQNFMT
jgi:hypothetical protein